MFWGVTLESGKRYSQIVESSYHLSMAALEPHSREGKKPNKYVSVMIEHGKAEFLLCTLEYDRVMQVALDLLFVEGEEVSFFLNGEGTVHLTGYVTDNEDKSLVPSDESDEESAISDTEDTSYSRLLNMDDEIETTDEEWIPKKDVKEKKKLLKANTLLEVKTPESQRVPKPNVVANFTNKTEVTIKKEKQSPNKEKKKDEEDENVSSFSDFDVEMEGADEESDDDGSEVDEEDESDEELDDEEVELACPPVKKRKSVENDKGEATAKSLLHSEQKKGSNKTPSLKETPRVSATTSSPSSKSVESKKKVETVGNKTKPETPFRNKLDDSNLQKTEEKLPSSTISDNTPKIAKEDSVVSLSKKKKKKKRSLSEDKSSTEEKSFTNTPKQVVTPSSKLQGGVKATDIKQGNGPQAKKGRFVHICYVGRLTNGNEFDSARDRPFSFRLGHGEVIKGLDMGIEGMKVGGKRKLTIPPTQGYGNKKCGPIPPNSTLEFEVELKAVS